MTRRRGELMVLALLAAGVAAFLFYRWHELQPSGPFSGPRRARGDVTHVEVVGDLVDDGVYAMPPGSTLWDLLEQAGFQGPPESLTPLGRDFPLIDGNRFEVTRGPNGEVVIRRGNQSGRKLRLFFSRVDINTATVSDLQGLPGVGEDTARAIVRYREAHGPFAGVDDLLKVDGVGPKTLEKLRPEVYAGTSGR